MKLSKKDQLIEAAINGEDFGELVNIASKLLNNPLVIISNSYNIIAYSKTFSVDDSAWTNATKRGYITLEFGATLNNWNQHVDHTKNIDCITVTEISKYTRRFLKMVYKGKIMGYLNITDVNNCLDKVENSLYLLVASLLAKEIAFNHRDYSNHTATFEEILFELSNDAFINKLHFIDRVSSCNVNIQTQYQVACVDLKHFTSYNAREDNFKNEILSFFPKSSIIINNQLLIILIDLAKRKDTLYSKKLENYLTKKELIMGVSDTFHDLYEFKHYIKEAKSSIYFRKFLLKKERIINYDQIKQFDLLNKFSVSELPYYCNQKLYNLYIQEKGEGTEYIKTLRTYLEFNHSVKETAEVLFIHRNTVNYRIQRIKELLEIEIGDNHQINELLFSCALLQIIEDKYNID